MTPFLAMAKPMGPACNLACRYCFYLDKQHELYPDTRDFCMSPEVLELFIRQYIEAHPGPVVPFVWQGGEPTLRGLPFYQRVVDLQKRHLPRGWQATNALQTNGLQLNSDWARFLATHGFLVGISLDGPQDLHDTHRVTKQGLGTHARVMAGLRILQKHRVNHNVLCVVHRHNAPHPERVYGFLRSQGVRYLQFIPVVEPTPDGNTTPESVSAQDFGRFLCRVFDHWVHRDVGRVYVQFFEEMFCRSLGVPAGLCTLGETCGDSVVVEHNGDVYVCDHFVTPAHWLGNLIVTPLGELARLPARDRFGQAKKDALNEACLRCDVRTFCHGGCPKDRFVAGALGGHPINYLCPAYKGFFRHALPAIERMAGLHRSGHPPAKIMERAAGLGTESSRSAGPWSSPHATGSARTGGRAARRPVADVPRVGRNDACPCGSGRKYKRCCLPR